MNLNTDTSPFLGVFIKSGMTGKPITYGFFFFVLLLCQPAFALSQFYAHSGSNCGPNEWSSFGEARAGCEAGYRAYAPAYTEPPWLFVGSEGISPPYPAEYEYGIRIAYGLNAHTDLSTGLGPIFARGGAGFVGNFCKIGATWNPDKVICEANIQRSAGPGCSGRTVGNPCDAATGNKYQEEIDYLSLAADLSFVRYYNSLETGHYGQHYAINNQTGTIASQYDIVHALHDLKLAVDNGTAIIEHGLIQTNISAQSTFPIPSISGTVSNWSHNYSAFLAIDEISQKVIVHRANGKEMLMTYANGLWEGEPGNIDRLEYLNGEWLYKTNDTTEVYNTIGKLTRIVQKDGKTTTLTYNDQWQLTTVTSPFNRTLEFAYDGLGRLESLTTPDNERIKYHYDTVSNLARVTYPDATPENNDDNDYKIYHYEDNRFPNHLTGITNENGSRYATWHYQADGKAISSEHANGAEKVELVFNTNSTIVTDALGRKKTFTFANYFGVPKPTAIVLEYDDGKQIVTKSKTYTYYPDNGWLKQVNDYNSNITYYEYNTRGLITLETQAKGTPEEYTVTTTWHPDFRLPATKTYPNKTVSYGYDLNGQLTATNTTANP